MTRLPCNHIQKDKNQETLEMTKINATPKKGPIYL